jgi:voltage-gated potassium channel
MPQLLKRLLLIAGLLSAALLIGTFGFAYFEGWTLFDSFYMTLITLTTVGYGEIHPLDNRGRVFASFLMLIGVTTVFVSIAILGETLLRLELTDYFGRRRRDRMLRDISGHYIVCGAGRVGRSVIEELLRRNSTVVLIDNSVERARWGTDKVITLVGDATKDEVLRQARIDTAKGLVAAISSDAENVYVSLSAKVLNPQLVIAARASDEQAEEKLRRAGATTVFTPYSFIGHRLAQSLLRPHVATFLDVASAFRHRSDLDLEIEQVQISASSPLASKTLGQLKLGSNYGVIVLAVQHANGVMQFNPPADLGIESGDVLIAMGESTKLKRLEDESGRGERGSAAAR